MHSYSNNINKGRSLQLRADAVTVAYGSNIVALENASLDIYRGDFLAITGPNGGGKSTLLRALLGLVHPASGKVVYYDENGKEIPYLKFGYLPQKSNIDSRYPITVEEVVASGLLGDRRNWRGKYSRETQERIDVVLQQMGIGDLRHRVIGALSGGQLQRTLLGRAVISSPEIVVLDEPLSYVDHAFVEQIYKIIDDIARHATMVLVSHEMTKISEMANRHFIVDHNVHECHASHHFFKTECE